MFGFAKSPAPAEAGASQGERAEVESKLAEAGTKVADAENGIAQLQVEVELLKQMVDQMPLNVMMCDPQDLSITYINQTRVKTLKSLEHLLPVKADQLMGQCIDTFHNNPEHQRRILRNPAGRPYNAQIKLGGEWLDLQVNAITDEAGDYIGPMLSWSVATEKIKAEAEQAQLTQMVDQMPINVMMCDPDSLEIHPHSDPYPSTSV